MRALEHLVDPGSFVLEKDELQSTDPLGYPGYREESLEARVEGVDESVVAGRATISGRDVEVASFEFSFFAGSLGEVAGERLARAVERAAARRVPFVLRTATGGARMQEGMRALVQMPKLVVARLSLAAAHQPFLAVLGNPTTGGVLASIGALADITIAENQATIGFAGPRLVERFTGSPLQADSHNAVSALANGLVDAIAPPENPLPLLKLALDVLAPDEPEAVSSPPAYEPGGDEVDAWNAVERARDEARPRAPELVTEIVDQAFHLRGDRAGGEDLAVAAAFARIAGRRVVVLALDRTQHPGPRAYRKACRCIDLAARLDLPVVTLVDTPGADPSEASEAGGIAWSIAELLRKMLAAPVPLLAIVTGEGGSGGALAFSTADVLLAYEGSVFSVIAPEAAAEILWRDPARAGEAARLLKVTAPALYRLGIADGLIPEPLTPESLRQTVAYHLGHLQGGSGEERAMNRRRRWRMVGT